MKLNCNYNDKNNLPQKRQAPNRLTTLIKTINRRIKSKSN